MKQCFIFRTHKICMDDKNTLLNFKLALTGYCDVILSLNVRDTSKNSLDIVNWWQDQCKPLEIPVVVFTENKVLEKYPFYKGAWLHSQYCFTETFLQKSSYDYYWFIEYDARICGSAKDLLEHHAVNQADLLGTYVNTFKSEPRWNWWKEQHSKLELPLDQRMKYFPALSRLSRRLLERLVEAVSKQYSVVETLVPTVCAQTFGTASVHNLDARFWIEVGKSKQSGSETVMPTTVRFTPPYGNEIQYDRFIKPLGATDTKLYHPIKDQKK